MGNILYNLFYYPTEEDQEEDIDDTHAEEDLGEDQDETDDTQAEDNRLLMINYVQKNGRMECCDIFIKASPNQIESMRKIRDELKEKILRLKPNLTYEQYVENITLWTAGSNVRVIQNLILAMEDAVITQQLIDGKKDTCSVCLDKYNVGEAVKRCPGCKNFIHDNCIRKWMTHPEHQTCPLCRQTTSIV